MNKIINYIKNNKYQSILYFLVLVSFLILSGYIIYVHFYTDTNIFDELRNKEKPLYLVNIAIVLAAFGTAIFTWWKNNINQRMSLTQEVTRQDSLFAKAVEFLKDDNLITQKAGVHILKDLAVTSPQQTQKCLDLLCSLNEIWMPFILDDNPEFFDINKDFVNIKNLGKLVVNQIPEKYNNSEKLVDQMYLSQLVLHTVSQIIKYVSINKEFQGPFDLSHKYLCSINLANSELNKFIFENSNLQSATLNEANFNSVSLSGANLQSSTLKSANLQNTFLFQTNLQNTNLNKANFESARIIFSNFKKADLSYANLQSVKLIISNFQSADLSYANFQFSNLFETKFQAAILDRTDFRETKNLDSSIFDENKKNAIFTDEDFERLSRIK